MPTTIPLLLDTDIGSDIDDAVALAYLLKQPRCDLLGITTVTGDKRRAALAEVVCAAAGRTDVPIHCGAGNPLLIGPGQPNVPHYDAIRLGENVIRSHRMDWPVDSAIPFLRETIRSRPGEITLLSIGPLTNIALLFAVDPEIPPLLKGFVSMAGRFFDPADALEWNCLVDPIATAMVYRATGQPTAAPHTSIGLDVTLQCTMPAEEVRQRFIAPPLDVVATMAEVWFSQSAKKLTFHDPLAAAVIFEPDLCEIATGKIDIELDIKAERTGQTRFTEGAGPHRVARTVQRDRFFKTFFAAFE